MYQRRSTQQIGQRTFTTERFRQLLALLVLGLFLSWLLVGLVFLILQGTFTVLLSSLPLAYPVYRIVCYYFGQGRTHGQA